MLHILELVAGILGLGVAFSRLPDAASALAIVTPTAVGLVGLLAFVRHFVFHESDAKRLGWESTGAEFQYEVGFANLAVGLAGIYAANQDASQAWIAAALAGGVFLALAGAYHVVEIVRDRNYAPGNTAILISDFGTPISLLVLLLATNAI